MPAHPVALIAVDPHAGTVSVNGQPVDVDEGADPYVAGVHAAARRVAQVLQRPVRALGKDPGGQTALVVHPDGSVSDIEETAPPVTGASPRAGVAVGQPSGRPRSPAPKPKGTQPVSRPGNRPRGIALVSIAASLAVVVTVGTALLMGARGDGERISTAGDPSETATTPEAVPALPYEVRVGGHFTRKPVTTVEVRGGERVVRLVVTSSEQPARAVAVLVRVGGASAVPVERRFRLTGRGKELVFKNLSPGTYRWRVAVRGAEPATGRVQVTAPPPVVTPPPTVAPEPEHTPDPGPGTTATHDGGPRGDGNGSGGGGGGPDQPVDPAPGEPEPTGPVPH